MGKCEPVGACVESAPEPRGQLQEHFDGVHYGFRQPPAVISQAEFEGIGSWPMIRRVHTCIVCLGHHKSNKGLKTHLVEAHPPRTTYDLMPQTDVGLLQYWVDLLRSMYGQGIIEKIINKNIDIVDGSIIKI